LDRTRSRIAIVVLGAAALAVANLAGTRFAAWIPLRCPVRTCTGLECPTCGLGRGLLAAAGGDFAGAWAAHPLALLLVPALCAYWLFARAAPAAAARTRALAARPRVALTAALLYTAWGFLARA
jgi:hypothetical protein